MVGPLNSYEEMVQAMQGVDQVRVISREEEVAEELGRWRRFARMLNRRSDD